MKLPLAILVTALVAFTAYAGPGHDHGDDAAPPSANGPQRLPDGSVFLPKPSQRQLGVRTTLVARAELPTSITLNGRVILDPNAGGRVQPMLAGRIEPGPRGLPSLGQRVRKGELLAYVHPSASQIERGNQAAQLAELSAQRDLAVKRLARLESLEGSVPQRDIEVARADAKSLQERAAVVGASLRADETLVASADGVISTANAVAGQVVNAGDVLFEIVDPARMRIEAVTFDPALAADIGAAALDLGSGRTVPLAFIGAARTLRDLALPLQFRTTGGVEAPLAVGQPVKVIVQSRRTVEGIAVPAAALVRNPANETIVWEHTGAERFVPRVVRYAELDGANVAVLAGLEPGARVVTQGASLVNQVR
ncbi:MAG: HlyD family efflux transporter periplasmic adaptor subunit [Anaerolineae bacterium]|jgi:hypothetical protein|nr:HlyD family efflux transporter periplasmic adaptor subunit [Anaerolineae bacterium]